MPHSLRDNDQDVREYVWKHEITSLLDVGAGSGTYGRLLGDVVPVRDAVEVWQPYVTGFHLTAVYRQIYNGDIVKMAHDGVQFLLRYDLIIFGDVLEHMSTEDGQAVWAWARTVAQHALISVPTVHWPQGHGDDGNPHEAHVQECVTPEEFRAAFGPFDVECFYPQTATFFKQF